MAKPALPSPRSSSPVADGRRLVDGWKESGLSQAAYARQAKIPTHRLYYWIRKLARPSPDRAVAAPAMAAPEPFVQIPWQVSARTRGPIEIHLASGALVRAMPGADLDLLQAILRQLAAPAC